MKIKAIADRIFVRLEPVKDMTPGGVLVLSDIPEPRTVGTVESVGEQVKNVKPGDRVLFHVFDELETPETDVVAVRENSILGVLDDE
jgi:co-chaperonin GroES (HSP10)